MFLLFKASATTAIYTLSLHDALPISLYGDSLGTPGSDGETYIGSILHNVSNLTKAWGDRKSTRLNSSHVRISYAVFCLKKKIDPMNYKMMIFNLWGELIFESTHPLLG